MAEREVMKANIPGKFETVIVRPRLIWGKGDTTLVPNMYGHFLFFYVVALLMIVYQLQNGKRGQIYVDWG
jgi:hypothetical protein